MLALGINSAYHESAACLVRAGRTVAAVEEERFSRRKHGKAARVDNPDELSFLAIRHCFAAAGATPSDVERIGLTINPERRLGNQHFPDPSIEGDWGSASGEQTFYEHLQRIPQRLVELGFRCSIRWLDHHRCHAVSTFLVSPFQEAAVMAVDGIGETTSALLAHGRGRTIRLLDEIDYPASLGFVWEKLCKFLGFGEYDACKVMGLAAYGDARRQLDAFRRLVQCAENGKFQVDADALRFRCEEYAALEALFGCHRRTCGEAISGVHEDIAAAMQEITNEVMLHMAQALHEKTGARALCIVGGVGLNCVVNQQLLLKSPFSELFVQPAAHDAGTALGAALLLSDIADSVSQRPQLRHAYLGPSFDDAAVSTALKEQGVPFARVERIEERVAELLGQGAVVGWFQGAMEFGPRALGNRSLLADPRRRDMRDLLNRKVKHREDFRPFASSVLHEEASNWFELPVCSPAHEFMLVACPVKEEHRARIPAVVHVDGTCRIQAVRKAVNPRFHSLISAFFARTGVPVLLNTSFNDDEPIVCTPEDAIHTFKKTHIDYLAINDFLVERPQGDSPRQV